MKSKTLRKKIFQKSNRKELCINLFENVKHNFHPIFLSFQMGRNKLQNKLKRAKGRNITKVEEESKESSPELDHLARQETSEAKVEDEILEDHVENIAGLGEMDLDGYHGVHRLPQIPLLPWKLLDRARAPNCLAVSLASSRQRAMVHQYETHGILHLV